jgi:hypothetical protein
MKAQATVTLSNENASSRFPALCTPQPAADAAPGRPTAASRAVLVAPSLAPSDEPAVLGLRPTASISPAPGNNRSPEREE